MAHTEPTALSIPFETLVREMLEQLGEDPAREGLKQTPARVEASLKWLTRGYGMVVEDVIGDALFEEKHESMICVRDIEIYSMCEHHMLPFFGKAHVAYIPSGKIIGLSKMPRIVDVF
ncbi:MAG: GTP cyclohydrolase I, partial [Gemmatimonadales bacterium]|nr:GTP cyclohydrolase I [Gemmatimonadales bacterium]